MAFQPFDDQPLGCPISLRDQIELAFQLEGNPSALELLEEHSRFVGDLHRGFQV
jgi:hypothetical protein